MGFLTDEQAILLRRDIVRALTNKPRLVNAGEQAEEGRAYYGNQPLPRNDGLFIQLLVADLTTPPTNLWVPRPRDVFIVGMEYGSNTSGRQIVVGGVNMGNKAGFVDDGATGPRSFSDVDFLIFDSFGPESDTFRPKQVFVPAGASVNFQAMLGLPVRIDMMWDIHDPALA